ncbi:MAG: DUF368 domain-containing protein [Oscillospiraceae bacterium]|nr:DUF368 domain-containing protein [Oscillospiraceae bacterium]
MNNLITALKGFALGIAFVVPGFSGGTMAVILKIYDRLLNAISLSIEKLKKNFFFLLFLATGMAAGVFATAVGLSWLFENHPVPTSLVLTGIVLGSLPTIWKECTSEKKFNPVNIIPFIIAFAVMVVMFFIENAEMAETAAQTEFSAGLALKLAAGGFVAAVSMVIPGLSGSLMLTIMGMYETAIAAVKDLNIALIAPVGIGAAVGILSGAKLISVLLRKFRQGTYAVIIGLIAGSLLTIFPSDFAFNSEGIIGIVLGIIGFIIPIVFDRLPAAKEASKGE